MVGTSNLGSWNGHWYILHHPTSIAPDAQCRSSTARGHGTAVTVVAVNVTVVRGPAQFLVEEKTIQTKKDKKGDGGIEFH